jgi:hypothetical protein
MPPRRISAAVAFTAAALCVLQISFTRLLSYKLFYHFVFLAIALSLLGLGAAGAFVALRSELKDPEARLRRWLSVLAALTPLALIAMARPPFTTHSELNVKLLGNDALLYLGWCSSFMVALNFAGGVVLSQTFQSHSSHMGRLYACDLAGAGAGCLLSVALMKYLSPPAAFLSAALLTCAALAPLLATPGPRRGRTAPAIVGGLTLGLAAAILALPGTFGLIDFGRSPRNLGSRQPLGLVEYEWNHLIRTDHTANGWYVLDGEASTPMTRWDTAQQSLPIKDPTFLIGPPSPDVAVIGFGGGRQVAEARRANASQITAIDINPTISRWVKQNHVGTNRGLFEAPNIQIINDDGRHAIRRLGHPFDVIEMHSIDTYAATAAGAYALTENFLYTKEALKDYLGALKPGGVMSIQRWEFNPPRENLRIFATLLEAMAELGYAQPERHVMMLLPIPSLDALKKSEKRSESRALSFLMFSPTPFSDDQLARARDYLSRFDASALYLPGGTEDTAFSRYVRAPDRAAFRSSYPYVITPVSDASPYVFQYYDPFHLNAYRMEGDWATSGIYQSSAVTLVATLLVSIVASALFILLPLAWASWRGRRESSARLGWRSMVFFSCLGVGFMALEVPLTQVLALYLGHPVYGFSVVLVALLLSSGAGSLLSERLKFTRVQICCLVAAVMAGLGLGVFPLVHGTMGLPDFARFSVALLLVVACGLPMGFPLALAVRELGRDNPRNVAWAWGVNGAASVVGSCLVMLVMVFGETRFALGLASLCYAVAGAVSYRARRAVPANPPPSSDRAGASAGDLATNET